MARILGAVASSHTPTIGFALDTNKQNDPVWAPIFKDYEPVQKWLAEKKPDVMLMIFNDHVTSFFFDHYSQFALGIGERWEVADEGGGPRDIPGIDGHPKLAAHIAAGLVADEFDLSYFQDKGLDHGCFSPLSILLPHNAGPDKNDWPAKMVPLQVGVLEFPIPSAKRCYNLGKALRKAIESYPEDLGVVIVATGGLSHQVHGERCGFNNTKWDMEFLDLLAKDPESLTNVTIAEYAERGGMEGSEIIMWLIMRGAMNSQVKVLHQSYYLPSMTAIVSAIYENDGPSPAKPDASYTEHINKQLKGIEKIEGTYPFTLDLSVKAYRLNKFLHNLVNADFRKQFRADPEALFTQEGLTEEEKTLVRDRNWRGLIHYGVIFFMLEKFGAAIGVGNLHIYAAMRGQTIDEFQKTRNAAVTYSVAGKETIKSIDQQPKQ
jgi:gallate dioxygenase